MHDRLSGGGPALDVVRRLFETLDATYSEDVHARALSLFAPDVAAFDWAAPGRRVVGREEVFSTFFEPAENAFSAARFQIDSVTEWASRVLMDITFSATFSGPYKGIAPHGGPISYRSRDLYVVRDERIVEMSFATDTLQFAVALGLTEAEFPW